MENNVYVDIHVLQNVPPSCVNRDDAGSPKTAKYGGAVRARVSSQCWKHEIRKYFKENFDAEKVGTRTKKICQMITDEIKKLNSAISDKNAQTAATTALDNAGIKLDKDGISAVLMFFSKAQAVALAKLAVDNIADKKAYKTALNSAPSVDMVLFGRMVATDADLNYDAAAQVAHAISTHAIHNEYDYFTAVDDLSGDDETGAGHLGTIEFNSSTLYRYSTVNAVELKKHLGGDAPGVVRKFAEAFIKSMPTGKQNTFANRTMPDYIYITLRKDQPVNLVGAFEKPIKGTEGYLENSKKELCIYADNLYEKYDCAPVKSWNLDETALPKILEELEAAVKEMLSEGEEG